MTAPREQRAPVDLRELEAEALPTPLSEIEMMVPRETLLTLIECLRLARKALVAVEHFGPADGTHGACLECGKSDMVPHAPSCEFECFIKRNLAELDARVADWEGAK
jgi:hypothetical protein